MGRPRKKIDPEVVENMAALPGITQEEIAAVLKTSVDTLSRRFADSIKKGRERGKYRIRKWQYQAAEKGNITMLIWLGKQVLGQTDSPQPPVVEVSSTGDTVTKIWTGEWGKSHETAQDSD